MDDGALYSIGELARLTLVRTLRELGLGLSVIQQVLERESSLAEVAAMEADALAEQIRVLRVRQAVLTALTRTVGHEPTPWEIGLVHRVATLSDAQRRRLIDEFLDTALAYPALAGIRRSLVPDIPPIRSRTQLEAWIELAELAQADGFRSLMRRLTDHHAAERRRHDGMPPRPDLSRSSTTGSLPRSTLGSTRDASVTCTHSPPSTAGHHRRVRGRCSAGGWRRHTPASSSPRTKVGSRRTGTPLRGS
ncbi:MerR family transcriptional regulator [Saccharomonospora cyanea]|uniref:MerR family transcriptional regulator n=1 Tax=Saccharomonospora cyanea TaxID=40989 RepID=UPI0003102A4F|nr:MerR family transcriptional regulator [Saccharomonospora cyanea]